MKKIAILVMFGAVLGVEAAQVTLMPDADADIRSKDLADIGYNRTTMLVGNTNPDPSAGRSYKAYVRFKLPNDFGEATSATFTLSRAVLGTYDGPCSVSLLDDGISGETDWVEANTTGVNWNNAPGNITTSPSEFTNSAVVGTFTTLKAANGGVAGDSWSISGTNLVNALNEDSNGYVTLMIGRTGQSSSFDQFASSEHATYDAPELLLEYSLSGVVLAPDADVDIRSKDLADVGYNRTTMLVGNTNPDPSAGRSYKAYIRFKLPTDFSAATGARFTLSRAVLGAYDAPYSVSLLNDGVSDEADWSDADNSTGTTWNNAPGNITTSPSAFTNAAVVGTFTTLKAANGGVAGDSWSISGTNLMNALNEDSNGYVTLMIARTTQSSSSDQFASSEHATYAAPELWVDYTPIVSVGVVLVPNADADIRSFASATNSHNRDILAVINRYPDPSVGTDAKAYVRYKLPADFGSALSATFTISRAVLGAYDAPYSVSGLNDGVSGESDWVERDSFYEGPGGMSWDDAPGNITTSPSAFTNSAVVGTFTTLKAANGGVVGDSWSISGVELADFLNADSNGYVTLMIGRTGSSSSSDQFASRESASWAPPTLTLQYTSVPAYDAWIGRYPGVGGGTNRTDDADGDLLDNLSEFALGGDPSNPTNTGLGPEVGVVVDGGGTNWFTFVHAQRVDAEDVGLTYHVEHCADLVNGPWTNTFIEVTGTGVWDTVEFNAVTNRVMMDGESQQFLRLIIGSD